MQYSAVIVNVRLCIFQTDRLVMNQTKNNDKGKKRKSDQQIKLKTRPAGVVWVQLLLVTCIAVPPLNFCSWAQML